MLKPSKLQFENLRFKREKELFFIGMKLFVVSAIVFVFDVFILMCNINHKFPEMLLICHVLKLYSKIVIFNIVVLRDEVKILIAKKYRGNYELKKISFCTIN